jgi:hypothetical protein
MIKYLIAFLLVLPGCNTFNASVDGAQGIVNDTVAATGKGVANVTSAVGKDVTGTITYVTEGAADGLRNVTNQSE